MRSNVDKASSQRKNLYRDGSAELKVIRQPAKLLESENYVSVIVQVIALISVSIFSAFALRFLLMIDLVTGGLIGLLGYVALILLVDPPEWTALLVNSIRAIIREQNRAEGYRRLRDTAYNKSDQRRSVVST